MSVKRTRFNLKSLNKFIYIAVLAIIVGTAFISGRLSSGSDEAIRNLSNPQNNPNMSDREVKGALELQGILNKVAKTVTPAVVHITNEMKLSNRTFSNDPMFDELLKKFFGRNPQGKQPPSFGSGFVLSKDGYIITNNHVIQNSEKLTVTLESGEEYPASVVGVDDRTDVAVIKIEPKKSLAVAYLGDSSIIEVGDFAVAIGNPFGFKGSVSFGIISATHRAENLDEDANLKDYIQTDVPINPGNSGGPLINIKGEVIGVNTMIYSTTGGSIGLSFSIPINKVREIVNDIIKFGKVDRATLGITITDVTEDVATQFNITKGKGVFVRSVNKGSSADLAGIKAGDVILSVDGVNTNSSKDLATIISSYKPGSKAVLKILRNKKVESVIVTFVDNSSTTSSVVAESGFNGDTIKWKGMTFGDAKDYAGDFGYNNNVTGVIVLDLDKNSNAFFFVDKGFLVQKVDNTTIQNLNDLKKFSEKNKDSNSYTFEGYQGRFTVKLSF